MTQKLFTKNFTLLVLGQASSLFGNFILKFALSMHVLETTGSATIFAGILALTTIPTILLSPFGGILADRANRRNIMVALDALTGLSVLCAVLLFTESNGIAVIGVLLLVLSIFGAFESPTVQACVPQMQTGDNLIKGNAVVNQVAAVAALIAPILGSVFYVAFGLTPVMVTSIFCFFLTAFLECFIRLEYKPTPMPNGILALVKEDFTVSMRFLCKEQPNILKMILLTTLSGFFVIGTAMVGLPYIVRNILGLSAEYYGAAESALGVAAILGGISAGMLTGKLKLGKLSLVMAALGAFLIPAGAAFLLPIGTIPRYLINVAAFCGVQGAVSIFNIFGLSYTQQMTPNHLLGKVMAYISTITVCVQPLGQMVYGLLFDSFRDAVYLVLIPTGVIAMVIGLSATGFFRRLEQTAAVQKTVPPVTIKRSKSSR